MKYKDLFIDFDDTLYDTHGNAVIALSETFEAFHLEQYFADPQVFFDAYWWANIDLWSRYSKGEITRDYLIVERFRRPLSEGKGIEPRIRRTGHRHRHRIVIHHADRNGRSRRRIELDRLVLRELGAADQHQQGCRKGIEYFFHNLDFLN